MLLSADQATLSKPVMVRLAEEGVPILLCGKNYHPISITLPYANHHQSTKVLKAQIDASKAFKKRLWQKIVQQKIRHQHAVLNALKPQSAALAALSKLAQKVRSGDPDNIEAQAARLYWPSMFGGQFRRNADNNDATNAALNYGYTILRAACARAVMAAGLTPALGIHHHNQGNPFCLVEDLMEIYRPLVDWCVFRQQPEEELRPQHKLQLVNLLQADMHYGDQVTIVNNAMQGVAFALVQSFYNKSPDCLLPTIILEGAE